MYVPKSFGAAGVTTNPKVLGEIHQMSADMLKWRATGRLSATAVQWWTRYLAEVSVEREPSVPFVDTLPRHNPCPPAPLPDLTTSLLSAARGQAAVHSRQAHLKLKKRRLMLFWMVSIPQLNCLCILCAVLNVQIDSAQRDSNTTNWASNIRDILQSSGLN